jgi:hypothetical protein
LLLPDSGYATFKKTLRTTDLPAPDQRVEPIELIGVVVGTAGTLPYVHLQLETLKRMFGQSQPTLIVNDGPASAELKSLCWEYGAHLADFKDSLGHSVGDLRVFVTGFDWCKRLGLDVCVKLSRRFIPLIPWRWHLQSRLCENRNVSMFTRRHNDRPDGLFRTDAIAIRVSKLENPQAKSVLEHGLSQERVCVETIFEALSNPNGGWAMWDLLGRSMYSACDTALQWRGLLPHHYGDLSRALGLPYEDYEFSEGLIPEEKPQTPHTPTDVQSAVVVDPMLEPEFQQ